DDATFIECLLQEENVDLPLVLSYPPTLVQEVSYGVGFSNSSEHIDDVMQPLEGVGLVPDIKPLVDAHVYDDVVLIEDFCDASSVSSHDVSDGDVVPIEFFFLKEKHDSLVADPVVTNAYEVVSPPLVPQAREQPIDQWIIKLTPYDGIGIVTVDSRLLQFVQACWIEGYDKPDDLMRFFPDFLTGVAMQWYHSMLQHSPHLM
ncbi:hypothetical protein GOP47_0020016, partial [Adiantum capillus-veneris]